MSLFHDAIIGGEDFDEDKTGGSTLNTKFSRTMKCLEILGEALPQLLLNVVFILNNFSTWKKIMSIAEYRYLCQAFSLGALFSLDLIIEETLTDEKNSLDLVI